ncbi:MAG: hypothetical protein FWG50_09225 [Kiritimatiellaeota bacterium]|nr:hypothetical protein [Kiritimatiellota bacterium]
MNKLIELYGKQTAEASADWAAILQAQACPFLGRRCVKNRKSQPKKTIGVCAVVHGRGDAQTAAIICPHRLLEGRKIFMDSVHLLALHEPGNDLHIVPEVSIPGGSVDYFLVSARERKVKDFVGVELQTLDTTGSTWPARQQFIRAAGGGGASKVTAQGTAFGINWKMTAKTILVQIHHKAHTFEALGKHLVVVVQDCLLRYFEKEFSFGHVHQQPLVGDAVHFHAYRLGMKNAASGNPLTLASRHSTDSVGIATCLGLQSKANLELDDILERLSSKISERTLLTC